MADKPADIHTLAPRLSYVEDLATWLKDNRGSGGSGTTDETLWRATLTGAETSAGWSDDPWTQTDLIYGPTSPNALSMHQTVFGVDSTGALKCQDGKGLYGWIFPQSETRWQYGPENGDLNLANEIFDATDSGYVHALRAATISLMQAVFKTPAYVGSYTIIDRILDIKTELESFEANVETALTDLQTDVDTRFAANDDAHADINAQLTAIRSRLSAGGL